MTKVFKLFSAIMCAVMIMTGYTTVTTYADEDIATGNFGDNITWTLDGNVLMLTGNGDGSDFESDITNPSIDSKLRSMVYSIVIGEGITSIGENTFNGFYRLESVSFPKSIESIGKRAFYDSNLRNLQFPEQCSLSIIGEEAFSSIFPLETADLSNCKKLKTIEAGAFADCSEFTRVIFPQNGVLNTIESGAFENNTNIIRVSIPDTVETIGQKAFSGCNAMISAVIPSSVTFIGEKAFDNTKAVVFGTDGTEARRAASANNLRFEEGDGSEAVVIRQGKVSETISWTFDTNGTLVVSGSGYIGDFPSSMSAPWYYVSSAITQLVIEEGITGIGRENFATFRRLESVSFPQSLATIGEYAFSGCSSIKKITLPEGLATIAPYAFYSCKSLKEFHIPSTTYYVDPWAIQELESLEKFSVAQGNTVYYADECGVLFTSDKTKLIQYPTSCKITAYIIPQSVTAFDERAFSNTKYLEEVSFDSTSVVETIDNSLFSNSSIKKIVLPNGLKTIGNHAFFRCENLENIENTESIESIGAWSFAGTAIDFPVLPSGLKTIGEYAFSDCNDITDFKLPEGVAEVGAGAVSNCSDLESIYIPASLTYVDLSAIAGGSPKLSKVIVSPDNGAYSADEYGVLYYNNNEIVWYPAFSELKSFTVKQGITKIGTKAFYGATNLTEIILPDTLAEIGEYAFWGCRSLKSVVIPSSVKLIDTGAFRYCSALSDVVFEDNIQIDVISQQMFGGCTSLREFHLPDSVSVIMYNAFHDCTLLESIYVGGNSLLNSIGSYAFTGCPFVNIMAPEGSFAWEYAANNRIDKRVSVTIDGKELYFEVYPVIIAGRTLVPMRVIFEAVGASVEWNEEKRSVTSVKDGKEIVLTIDSDTMMVDSKEYKLDTTPRIIADATLVPLRAISEALGYEVSWNDAQRRVEIKTK
ncbi:MAG: leucine-rich repeat protein [Clostridia bacterium]|nr:leucine-rich repeat protein [Clostridia bacterium]